MAWTQAVTSPTVSPRIPLAVEAAALQYGQALGSGFAYPVTLTQVANWAASVESRGYQLAPASALATRR